MTVLDMVGAAELADYERRADEWATVVWSSWSVQHDFIRAELNAELRP